ncbi:MAG: protein kinase [Verrucomicrobiota bacterium]|nr:protein kinase [Verrucomicrobiota bacterium]
MFSSAKNQTLICEQCGSPLRSRAGENDCLHCLLSAGLEEVPGETSPDELTRRVYQHYEILNRPDGSRWELGRGAMGVSYKARDINLDTLVALKIINARYASRPGARQRFLQEARAAARLRHPNVASVFHFGTINTLPAEEGTTPSAEEKADGGDCFYAMEFVEGETLEARLRRTGPLSPTEAAEIGVQVARALSAAERRGLVHRDLKPANIMLAAEDGRLPDREKRHSPGEAWVKVIDFGLVQLGEAEQPAARFFGTYAFASPEQIEGRALDSRSDLYSLGATLWYALTGQPPRALSVPNAATPAELRCPPALAPLEERGVPAPLAALLAAAVAPNPDERPLSADAFGQRLQEWRDGVARPIWKRMALPAAIAAALIALALILFSTSGPRDKTIAVLPFRNLSNDPANAFFVDGIRDDILSRLVKIRDLKVISRMGAARYSANVPRDLQEIGSELGARHVVEGSLRREGDHIFLHVALIDTRDGRELWAEGYDRNLADTINLQGELANDIASVLNATLSPQESAGLRAAPTNNPDAFVLYLRGRKFEASGFYMISDFESAEALYSQAIALDPEFALAHARLASTLSVLYRVRGPSEELRARSFAEAREALRLQPNLGEAHLANALCSYRIDRDFAAAMPELETARRLLPNDTEAESFIAYIKRRRGLWREARAGLERCMARDPGNVTYQEELYTTAYLLRDWPSAESNAARAETISPTQNLLKVQRALVAVWKDGDVERLRKVFAAIPTYGDPEGITAWMRWDAAMMARDFTAAQEAIDTFPYDTLPSVYSAPVPKSYLEGCIALATGDNARAQEKFEAARPAYEAEALAHPESALRHARLGLLYAYMGRREDAIREGKRAVELKPIAEDHFEGPEELCNLALIHARLGENDKAIAAIEELLRTPGGVFFYEASMSLWELRLRWQWDPLRSDPRFQKILSDPEPTTIF